MKKLLIIIGIFISLTSFSQTKLSELPSGSSIGNDDIFPYVQSGTTYKCTFSLIKSSISIPYVNVTSNDVKIGSAAGTTSTADGDNIIIGRASGSSLAGYYNITSGLQCGLNLFGNNNDITGSPAGYNAITSYSFLSGIYSGYSLNANYCFGALPYSLYSNTGANTIGIGQYTGYNNNKSDCLFLGQQSGRYSTGAKALGIGPFSLFYNISANNIAIGDSVLYKFEGHSSTVVGNNSFATTHIDTMHGNTITSFGYNNNAGDSSICDFGIFGSNMVANYSNSFYFGNTYDTINFYGGVKNDSSEFTIYDSLIVTGTSDLQSTISNSTGDITIADNLDVTGSIDFQGDLVNSETDLVTINDNVDISGDVTIDGTHTQFVYGGDDAGYTLPLTVNVYAKVTNATNSQFSQDNNNVLTIVGDSVTFAVTGDYKVQYNLSILAASATDCNLTFQIIKNGSVQVGEYYFSSMKTGTHRSTVIISGIFDFTATDYFELQVKNTTNSDDMIIATGLLEIIKM